MADKTEKKPGFVARMKAAVKNFGSRVSKFFRDSKSELKNNTILVLLTVAIAAVVMIALDAIFGGILGLIIGA